MKSIANESHVKWTANYVSCKIQAFFLYIDLDLGSWWHYIFYLIRKRQTSLFPPLTKWIGTIRKKTHLLFSLTKYVLWHMAARSSKIHHLFCGTTCSWFLTKQIVFDFIWAFSLLSSFEWSPLGNFSGRFIICV